MGTKKSDTVKASPLQKLVMWDYYYSAEQEARMIENAPRYIPAQKYFYKLYDGKPFTEMVKAGTKPMSNFSDLELVGTGDDSLTAYHT